MTRSIQQLPNNTNSSSVVEVATATGFNAGDLVYYANGDYKPPSSLTAPSAVSFPITGTLPTASSNGIQSTIQPVFGATQQANTISGGTGKRSAAVLTNGNIVQVFNNTNSYATNIWCAYFQIVSPTGTIVVSPTVVSTTYTMTTYTNVCVTALTGGGFVVAFVNQAGGTSYLLTYGIYTNAGAVTTAVQQDTGQNFSTSNSLEIVSLANGGFAVAAMNTSGTLYFRAYGATGTAAFGWTSSGITSLNLGNTGGYAQSFAMASRSDSSIFLCNVGSLSVYYYALFSSAGATIVSASNFSISNAFPNAQYLTGPDATVLSDGTTIVIAYYSYNGSNATPCFRLLPTGNTLGSQITAIPSTNANYQVNATGNYINALGLSSGGFALVFSDGYNTMQYAFYNSSGTCVSGTNTNGAVPLLIYGGFTDRYQRVTMLESSGYLNLYWCNGSTGTQPYNQFFVQINESNYQLVIQNSVSSTLTTLTAAPGSSVPSTVRPTSVAYYPASTSTTSVTNSVAAVLAPQTLTISAMGSISNCTLTSGNYVIAYATSGGSGTVNIYNSSNTSINTFTFTGNSASSYASVRLAALSNGGFVLGYVNSSNASVITLAIYSSSYSLVTTVTQLMVGNIALQQPNYDIVGLSNGGFVIAFCGSTNYPYYSAWSNTGTVLQTGVLVQSYSAQNIAIASNIYGGFAITYFDATSTAQRTQVLLPRSSTAWYASSNSIYSSASTPYIESCIASVASGAWIYAGFNGSNYNFNFITDAGNTQFNYYTQFSATQPNPAGVANSGLSIGYTGSGSMVMMSCTNNTTAYLTAIPTGITYNNNQLVPYSATYPVTTTGITISSSFQYGSNAGATFKVSPLAGNNCLITWLDSSAYPRYAIYSVSPSISSYTLTAGTSVSSQVPINPNLAITTNVNGVLSGVAATTTSAGSTGQVIINGLAQLNSNYSTLNTGAFDYTGQAVDGVKGTYNGRNVNLQGNS
jgi:hypothetical protein